MEILFKKNQLLNDGIMWSGQMLTIIIVLMDEGNQ